MGPKINTILQSVTSYLWRISKPWLILGSHVSATWGVLDPEGIPQLLVSSECLANLKLENNMIESISRDFVKIGPKNKPRFYFSILNYTRNLKISNNNQNITLISLTQTLKMWLKPKAEAPIELPLNLKCRKSLHYFYRCKPNHL